MILRMNKNDIGTLRAITKMTAISSGKGIFDTNTYSIVRDKRLAIRQRIWAQNLHWKQNFDLSQTK